MLVVGVGTGVNAAPVHPAPGRPRGAASECGHVNMPVRTEEDLAPAALHRGPAGRAAGEVPHGGVEEVLAGRGLANLHAFAAAEAGQPPA